MTTFEAHRAFVANAIIPLVVDYANRSNIDLDEAVLGVFLYFGILVQMRGYLINDLLEALGNAYVAPHSAPEMLQ